MDIVLKYKKAMYSENVLRRALYWLSSITDWTVSETTDSWIVSVENSPSSDIRKSLDRLLNDQLLREKIDIETGYLRSSIVKKVLKDLDEAS